MEKKYKTFNEFYPYYLTEHSNKANRALHFLGTCFFLLILIVGLVTLNLKLFLLMPIVGYGFAWVGHFFIEKNKPATFTYPLYSLISDFYMFWHTITGQLNKKLIEATNKINNIQ